MKKILLVLLTSLIIFTGCSKNKKEEPKKEEKKEEVIIQTSPNLNFDSIENDYKEILDEYLSYVPLRKINIYSMDAYSGKTLTVDKASKGLLAISSANVYKKTDKEIKSCGDNVEDCAVCFDSNNCILKSEIVEKLELYYNKYVTPSEVMNDLYSKLYLGIDYSNPILKIGKVVSFETKVEDLIIYEKVGFAYQNSYKVDVYKTSNKDEKVLSIESDKINSKEVVDEVLKNIDKFNTYKHTFKLREGSSDFYNYWYSTEVE